MFRLKYGAALIKEDSLSEFATSRSRFVTGPIGKNLIYNFSLYSLHLINFTKIGTFKQMVTSNDKSKFIVSPLIL